MMSQTLAMTGRAVAVVAVGLAHAAAPGAAEAQRADRRNFTLVNGNQRVPIVQVWVTSAARTDWGLNILRRTIPRGGSTRLVFNTSSQDCVYDVRVRFQGGRTEQRMRVNLCSTGAVVFQ